MHFNERYGRVGHLFQSRFGSRLLQDESEVTRVFSYIAANPVAASLCAHPEDWEWSSFDATVSVVRHALLDLPRLRAFLHAADTCALTAVEERLVSAGLRAPA